MIKQNLSKLPTVNFGYSDLVREKRRRVSSYGVFIVRPARTYSNGCKSPTRPNSGKRPANDQGIHREKESEGSLRQRSGLTNRNLIPRLTSVDQFAIQNKILQLFGTLGVNQAGIRLKEYVHNWGGLTGEVIRAVTTNREKSAEVIVTGKGKKNIDNLVKD